MNSNELSIDPKLCVLTSWGPRFCHSLTSYSVIKFIDPLLDNIQFDSLWLFDTDTQTLICCWTLKKSRIKQISFCDERWSEVIIVKSSHIRVFVMQRSGRFCKIHKKKPLLPIFYCPSSIRRKGEVVTTHLSSESIMNSFLLCFLTVIKSFCMHYTYKTYDVILWGLAEKRIEHYVVFLKRLLSYLIQTN